MFSVWPPLDWVEVGRGGLGNRRGTVRSALGGFLRGGAGGWEGKVKKNFYPEFARLGRGGAHQKGNLLERFVPLPDTLKYTFLNRRAHTGQGFCKEKLRIEQRLSGERRNPESL